MLISVVAVVADAAETTILPSSASNKDKPVSLWSQECSSVYNKPVYTDHAYAR